MGVCQVTMLVPLDHLFRELVDHRQEAPVLDLPVTHFARIVQLGLEGAGRRLIGLGGAVENEPLWA